MKKDGRCHVYYFLVFLCAGILVSRFTGFKDPFLALCLTGCFLLTAAVCFVFKPALSIPFFLSFIFCGGYLSSEIAEIKAARVKNTVSAGETGTYLGRVTGNRRKDSFDLLITSIDGQSCPAAFSVRVYDKKEELEPGDLLEIKARLRIPSKELAPRLKYRHIIFTATPERIRHLGVTSNIFLKYSNLIRRRLKYVFTKHLPPPADAVAAGMAFGDASGIPEDILQAFRETSTSHLLVVSGLHVGFMMLVFLYLGKLFRLNVYRRRALALAGAAMYVCLAAFSASILRAASMGVIAFGAFFFGKKQTALHALAWSALFMLLYDPWYLYDVSFQLSYASVSGILFFYERLADIFDFYPPLLGKAVAVSASAQLGVLPVAVMSFGQVSLVSLPANLFAVPVSMCVLPPAFFGAAFESISPYFARPVFLLTGLLIRSVLSEVSFLGSLPLASYYTENPLPALLLYLFFVYRLLRGKTDIKITLKHLLFSLLIIYTCFIWSSIAVPVTEPAARVLFFDVGQGDSSLLTTKNGENIIVDGGSSPSVLTGKLRSAGVRSLDYLILSHPHADHINGLFAVISLFKVKTFISLDYPESELFTEFVRVLNKKGVERVTIEKQAVYKTDGGVLLDFFPFTEEDENGNGKALVVKIENEGSALLYPGDIGEEAQEELAPQIGRVDIVKIPHHGAFSSLSRPLLQKAKPSCAVISVGRENRFGHPSRHVVAALQRLRIRTFRTDRDGDIEMRLTGGRIEPLTVNR